MEKIFDSEFYKKLQNITIKTGITVNGGSSGGRKSKAKGSSVEFSDYREYTPGDDFRRIDWNAYGRFNKLFVKLFMEEREVFINIFIDSSKSMDFGEDKKSTMALKISAVLAYLSINNLDRVCINSLSEGNISYSPSITGVAMFQKVVDYLQNIEFTGSTSINSSILKKEFKRNGISILISDFFSKDGIENAVKYLSYKKQQVILIHVLSEEELNPTIDGKLRLVDSESGEHVEVSVSPTLLKEYHKKLNSFTGELKEFSKKVGATYMQVSSSHSIEKVIFEDLGREGLLK